MEKIPSEVKMKEIIRPCRKIMNEEKMKIIIRIFSVLLLLFFLSGCNMVKVVLTRALSGESTPNAYSLPGKTTWKPKGIRKISTDENVNSRQVTFARAMHTDLRGSDEVSTVIAPAFTVDWTAEETFFVAEGPVFDRDGNIYFCPVFPPENVIMISIEPKKGKRRWVLEGFSAGAGTPIILEDPESGEDIIYVSTYDRAVAAKTDGTILWDVSTGLPPMSLKTLKPNQHNFGLNYHPQTDSLIAAMGDGNIYVLDRKTGKQLLAHPFNMPGAKTGITNFSLPEDIAAKANLDIAHMVGNLREDIDPVNAVLHIVAGELHKVTNFFSIDSNSGRIWIAATLPDEEDGKKDGWADSAALYGLDLIMIDGKYALKIALVTQVPGGTASTPAISADGKRVYVADAFQTVFAIDTNTGKKIWSIDVEAKINGSLTVSADNNEIYANTRTNIKKIIDRGDHAELIWTTNMDMYDTGLFQDNIKSLGAEIGANGIAFTGAAGIVLGKQKFPLRLGAGIIDRETGEIIYFADGAEDSVSSLVTGPDGGIYVGNSPLRRALGRAVFGKSKSPKPITGGITRFKPIHLDLIIRDALWAAANRARNTATFADTHPASAREDIFQIKQLMDQCLRTAPLAIAEGNLDETEWVTIKSIIEQTMRDISPENKSLKEIADKLNQAVLIMEK